MSLAHFPMFPADFDADTGHLSFAEDGAYNRLLRLQWKSPGCKMPGDKAWIYRKTRAVTDADQSVVDAVLGEFFMRKGGKFFNRRLFSEWERASASYERKISAGSKGGHAKALKDKGKQSSNAIATPQQPEPEPEPDKKEGGGVVREAGKTDREAILEAVGVDPVSGITGPSGRMIGTQADMAEFGRWLALPGITVPIILTEVRRIMAGKRDGPPSTFRFFTAAIQRLSGELSRPSLEPTTPTRPAGGRHDRQRFDQAINHLADGLSSGTVQLDTASRDPFAARSGGNA